MKKLLVAVLCAAAAWSACAERMYLAGINHDGLVWHFLYLDSVIDDEDGKFVWVHSITDDELRDVKQLYKIDCANRRLKLLKQITYFGDTPVGAPSIEDSPQWKNTIPHSVGESFRRITCGEESLEEEFWYRDSQDDIYEIKQDIDKASTKTQEDNK